MYYIGIVQADSILAVIWTHGASMIISAMELEQKEENVTQTVKRQSLVYVFRNFHNITTNANTPVNSNVACAPDAFVTLKLPL